MANKNTLLGGTDWLSTDKIKAVDLNDTFDAAATKIQSLSAFWLNTFNYTVYEDWDSYSTGTFAGNTKWDVTITATGGETPQGTCEVSNTQLAGGTTNEIYLHSPFYNYGSGQDENQVVQLTSLLIPSNSHIWFRTYWTLQGSEPSEAMEANVSIGNATDGWTEAWNSDILVTAKDIYTFNNDFFVVANGSNSYDVYVGGIKKVSALSLPNGCQIRIKTDYEDETGGYVKFYMDDVRYSTSAIN